MKLEDIDKEARDLELEINRYELLASQEHCRNRAQYLYYMWSYTHKLLKITNISDKELSKLDYKGKQQYFKAKSKFITAKPP